MVIFIGGFDFLKFSSWTLLNEALFLESSLRWAGAPGKRGSWNYWTKGTICFSALSYLVRLAKKLQKGYGLTLSCRCVFHVTMGIFNGENCACE